nr:Lrp/AsnC family transcriptional regulator [Paraburkholderia kururiensis]
MDRVDRKLLGILQENSSLSVAEMAELIPLSVTPCWRRLQRLEKDGYVKRRVVLLDAKRLNLSVTVFIEIKTSQHSAQWLGSFVSAIEEIPEIIEVYRLSGHSDYLLKAVVPDVAAYDAIYKKLIANVDLFDVASSFAMETIKLTTSLPLDYAT